MPNLSALLLYFAVSSVESVSVEKEMLSNAWSPEFGLHTGAHAKTQRREESQNPGIMRKEPNTLNKLAREDVSHSRSHHALPSVVQSKIFPLPDDSISSRNNFIDLAERTMTTRQELTTAAPTEGEKALRDGACVVLTWTKGMDDFMCSEGATSALTVRMDGKDHSIVKHGSACTVVCKSSLHSSPDPEKLTCQRHTWVKDDGSVPEIVCAPSRTLMLFGVLIFMVCCGSLAYYVQQSRKGPAPWGYGPGMQHGPQGYPGSWHGAPGYQSHHPPQYGDVPPSAGAAPQYPQHATSPPGGESASHGGPPK